MEHAWSDRVIAVERGYLIPQGQMHVTLLGGSRLRLPDALGHTITVGTTVTVTVKGPPEVAA